MSPSPIPNDRFSCFTSLFLDFALAADSLFLSSYKNLLKSRILATGGLAVSTNKTKSKPSSSAFFNASVLEITPKFSPFEPITLNSELLILSLIIYVLLIVFPFCFNTKAYFSVFLP